MESLYQIARYDLLLLQYHHRDEKMFRIDNKNHIQWWKVI
jgi:hypothetical protein